MIEDDGIKCLNRSGRFFSVLVTLHFSRLECDFRGSV
jgi:hypothetical protein